MPAGRRARRPMRADLSFAMAEQWSEEVGAMQLVVVRSGYRELRDRPESSTASVSWKAIESAALRLCL
jgi:hypothetical protein